MHFEDILDAVGMSVCPEMIISFLHLLLGQVSKQKKAETLLSLLPVLRCTEHSVLFAFVSPPR